MPHVDFFKPRRLCAAVGLCLLFLALFFSVAALLLYGNAATPGYRCGDVLTPEDVNRIYTLRGAEKDPRGLCLTLTAAQPLSGLALVISNSIPVSVYQEDVLLYSSLPSDVYSRTQLVPLRPIYGKTTLLITFSPGYQSTSPERHLLLGGETLLAAKISATTAWNGIFLGVLAMIFFSCLLLYVRKRSEQYLLHLTLAAFLTLLNLSITFNLLGLASTFQVLSKLRAVLLAVCCLQFVLIVQDLYPSARVRMVEWLRRVLSVAALLLALFILCGALPPASAYFFRLALIPDVLWFLLPALRQRLPGALCMLTAYALMEGFCFASYFATSHVYYGELFGFWRIIELAQVLFLLAATYVVLLRFAARFQQAEDLQKELAGLNATLESKVTERTRELKDQQLRRQTTMQNIFHDLRSPIYILQTQVRKMPNRPELAELHASLSQRLGYLQRLTEELFFVANLESDNVIFDEDEVDLHTLAERIADSLRADASERSISILCTGQRAPVWGDALHLQQAMQNLADNALRHTEDGGRICFETHCEGGCAVFSLCNSGDLIAPAELPLVFERYYRSKRQHNPRSSGLGLSIAKEIVEAHKGSIGVESSAEKGTTFFFRLPVL